MSKEPNVCRSQANKQKSSKKVVLLLKRGIVIF